VTESQEHVREIADRAAARGLTVATAESLTSGLIASRLGAGPNASEWFRGAVVAYQEPVKFEVLRVPEGPVVTAECAEQMARGVAELLGADAAVSVTGVGGPEPSEGEDPGTVYVGVLVGEDLTVHRFDLAGDDPDRILHETADRSLRLLAEALTGRAD
jgi:nicotinamide-nucleotide amidase